MDSLQPCLLNVRVVCLLGNLLQHQLRNLRINHRLCRVDSHLVFRRLTQQDSLQIDRRALRQVNPVISLLHSRPSNQHLDRHLTHLVNHLQNRRVNQLRDLQGPLLLSLLCGRLDNQLHNPLHNPLHNLLHILHRNRLANQLVNLLLILVHNQPEFRPGNQQIDHLNGRHLNLLRNRRLNPQFDRRFLRPVNRPLDLHHNLHHNQRRSPLDNLPYRPVAFRHPSPLGSPLRVPVVILLHSRHHSQPRNHLAFHLVSQHLILLQSRR